MLRVPAPSLCSVAWIPPLAETCGNEHMLKLLLARHPGELRIKLVPAGVSRDPNNGFAARG